MPMLELLRGASCSGKSTYAEKRRADDPELVVVSRDAIRFAFFGKYHGVDEEMVSVIERAAIREGLESGKDVLVDNTNVRRKFLKALAGIGFELGADVKVTEFSVDEEVALGRNLIRAAETGRMVPENVIRKQIQGLSKRITADEVESWRPPVFEKYVPDKRLQKCILFDIDGTLAEMNGKRGPFEWENVGRDDLVEHISDLMLNFGDDVSVILFSGRDGSARGETVKWLYKHKVNFDELHMREAGDMRPDTIVKAEMFNGLIRDDYWCLGVFDDRPSVIRMWLRLGLPTLHVKPYAKEF